MSESFEFSSLRDQKPLRGYMASVDVPRSWTCGIIIEGVRLHPKSTPKLLRFAPTTVHLRSGPPFRFRLFRCVEQPIDVFNFNGSAHKRFKPVCTPREHAGTAVFDSSESRSNFVVFSISNFRVRLGTEFRGDTRTSHETSRKHRKFRHLQTGYIRRGCLIPNGKDLDFVIRLADGAFAFGRFRISLKPIPLRLI